MGQSCQRSEEAREPNGTGYHCIDPALADAARVAHRRQETRIRETIGAPHGKATRHDPVGCETARRNPRRPPQARRPDADETGTTSKKMAEGAISVTHRF